MSTLQLTLPDEGRHFVDEPVARAGFGNADESVCALLNGEREPAVRGHLRALQQAGIDSGEPLPVDEPFWREREAALTTATTAT